VNVDGLDFYYLSMPEIEDVGDGSQDVLLVRARSGDVEGWGECEASPLVSIASLVAPMSHSACHPVAASVLGQRVDSVDDVRRIGALVRERSYDQLQAAHTLSGIDIALCDLLGKRFEVPVYELLGIVAPQPRVPYASTLFGVDPAATFEAARSLAADGYRAVKFGWQGFGANGLLADIDQLAAAREGLGADVDLLVDAAMAWGTDAADAIARVPALTRFGVRFIEEPFIPEAADAYQALKAQAAGIGIAGGEGCHSPAMAIAMMDHAGLDYMQVDTGRIGGITAARDVAVAAELRGVTFVNHTFTSHLALSASMQPYADSTRSTLCEFPVAPRAVSLDLTEQHLERDDDGLVRLPNAPGLGMSVRADTIRRYLVETEISVGGTVLYSTPSTADLPVAKVPG
jgi:L-alanine-DL-glutamate epimerase-like enolase superfamily enzyme